MAVSHLFREWQVKEDGPQPLWVPCPRVPLFPFPFSPEEGFPFPFLLSPLFISPRELSYVLFFLLLSS